MRSLAITALAALSVVSANAAAVVSRDNFVIFDFDVLDQPTCDFPDTQTTLVTRHLDTDNLASFRAGPTCLFFGGGTAPVSAGAIGVNVLGDACELFMYTDEACSTPPARPRQGGCVFNSGRFQSFAIECTGLFL